MNIVELIDANADNHPDKIALCNLNDECTFKQLKEKSEQAAGLFQSLGLKKGDPAAIMSQNTFDFVFSFFGILKAGGVAVPVNHKLTAVEVDYILKDSRSKFFLFDGSLKAVAHGLHRDIKKICLDTETKKDLFLQDAMEAAPEFKQIGIEDKDLAEILYTSGTTGNPKGCLHTHETVIAAGVTGVKAIDLNENDKMLIAMPIWHSSPLNNWFIGTTIVGGTTVIIREYHPLYFLEAIEKKSCTAYFGAPISYIMPLQMIKNFKDFNLTSMKAWIYGGGPIAPETVKILVANYKSDQFYQVYGMTEAGPSGTELLPEDHEHHAGSIGCRPLPGAEIKVMKDTETIAERGETGEIWLKAESMMQGYLNKPDENKKAFFDGWYRTGDMARIDQHGYLFIVDRIKDMIVTGGENVYSKEVEDKIMENEKVAEAAVIGVAHKDWGETVQAVVVPAKDAEITSEELSDFLKTRLAKFKIPRKYHFTKELPHTPSGKVMKFKLRREFQ